MRRRSTRLVSERTERDGSSSNCRASGEGRAPRGIIVLRWVRGGRGVGEAHALGGRTRPHSCAVSRQRFERFHGLFERFHTQSYRSRGSRRRRGERGRREGGEGGEGGGSGGGDGSPGQLPDQSILSLLEIKAQV